MAESNILPPKLSSIDNVNDVGKKQSNTVGDTILDGKESSSLGIETSTTIATSTSTSHDTMDETIFERIKLDPPTIASNDDSMIHSNIHFPSVDDYIDDDDDSKMDVSMIALDTSTITKATSNQHDQKSSHPRGDDDPFVLPNGVPIDGKNTLQSYDEMTQRIRRSSRNNLNTNLNGPLDHHLPPSVIGTAVVSTATLNPYSRFDTDEPIVATVLNVIPKSRATPIQPQPHPHHVDDATTIPTTVDVTESETNTPSTNNNITTAHNIINTSITPSWLKKQILYIWLIVIFVIICFAVIVVVVLVSSNDEPSSSTTTIGMITLAPTPSPNVSKNEIIIYFQQYSTCNLRIVFINF